MKFIDNDNKIVEEKQRLYDAFISANFARLARLTLQDLQHDRKANVIFSKYTKEDITKMLKNPSSYQKQLVEACEFLYSASSIFRRVVNYFARMSLMAYVVVPYGLDGSKVNEKMFKSAYYKTANTLEKMNLQHEFGKIMTVVWKSDIFFGYCYETEDSFFIRQIPSPYAQITSIEDGVFLYSVDFSMFNSGKERPELYGEEFVEKYKLYRGDGNKKGDASLKWQEIDPQRSICIKVNEETPSVVCPPFCSVLESLFELQTYKELAQTRSVLDVTKLLSFKVGTNPDTGEPTMDNDMRKMFYAEIDSQLPSNVGAVVTPFEVEDFNFSNSNSIALNEVANAEDSFFTDVGISQMLFNGNKNSSATLSTSIISDSDMVRPVLRQLERWINRRLKVEGKYKFKCKILNLFSYNIQEYYKIIKESGMYGAPVKSMMAAICELNPSDMLGMGYLENDVLKLNDSIYSQPFKSSATMSSDPTNEGGRPESDDGDLSDSGQVTKDNNTAEDRTK